MKKIIMMRHAHKEGDFLSQRGIEAAHNFKLSPGLLPIELVCSSKKPKALLTAMLICNGNKLNPKDIQTDDIWNPGNILRCFGCNFDNFNQLLKEMGTHYAVFQHLGIPNSLFELKEILLHGLKKIFKQLNTNGNCLLVAHSPIIEFTVEAVMYKPATDFFQEDIPFLGYVIFDIETESGNIDLLEIVM